MSKSIFNSNAFNLRNIYLGLGLVLLLSIFIVYLLLPGQYYKDFFQLFTNIVGMTTSGLLSVFYSNVNYIADIQSVKIDGSVIFLHSNFALRYYIYCAVVLFLIPGNYKKSFYLFLLSLFFLTFISVAKCFFEIVLYKPDPTIPNDIIISFRSLLIFYLLIFKLKANERLRKYYEKFRNTINEKLNIDILLLIVFVIIIVPFSRLLEYFEFESFVNLILNLSHYINKLVGYDTKIIQNYIFLNTNWVYLGKQCLGYGIDIMFVFLVFSIRSEMFNKILYSIFGLVILIVMNAVRISFILVHLFINGRYAMGVDAHDLSNYFFYTVVFILMLIYIFWFKDLNLNVFKKK